MTWWSLNFLIHFVDSADKFTLEKEKFRSLYFSLIASKLGCLWYLCTAWRAGSSIPFVAEMISFDTAYPNFGTIVLKYSIKISVIFWSSEIIISISTRVIVSKLFDLWENKFFTVSQNFLWCCFLVFRKMLTKIFLCLQYDFLQLSVSSIKDSFLSFDLVIIAFCNVLLARTDFVFNGAKECKIRRQESGKSFRLLSIV